MCLKWQFLFLLFLHFTSINAEHIVILNTEEKSDFGEQTSYFIDSTNALSLNDIVKLHDKFIPCEDQIFSPSPSNDTYWVKFQVKNLTSSNYYLVIDNPFLKTLEIFSAPQGSEIKRITQSGYRLPFRTREIQRNNYVTPLNLEKDKTYTIFIKYRSIRGELPLIISTSIKMIEDFEDKDFYWGIFFGVFIIVILYNFFLYIIIGDKSYIFYIAYIFFFCLIRLIISGYGYQYIFPNSPWFNDLMLTINSLLGIFSILFALNFLKIKDQFPKLHILGLGCIALYGGFLILSFINPAITTTFTSISVLIVGPFMLVLGILSYANGYTPARYYLLATSIFIVTILINNLRILRILPQTFFTLHAINFGILIEAVLFSIALGDRYNMYKIEREKAKDDLNRELQSNLTERAQNQEELKKMNKSLAQTNKDLDNFIYTASHDLKEPITNLEGIINLLNSYQSADKETKDIYEMMLSSVSRFRHTVNDLAEITRIQQLRENDWISINIKEILEDTYQHLSNEIEKSNAEIHSDLYISHIPFSKKNLSRITENLLSNAIKFRSPERPLKIIISTEELSDYYILSIKDNGLGIKKSNQEKIFSMFKKAHTSNDGRGIGLYITKRILENEGGRIEVESEENKGSTFKAYFKK